MKPLTLSASLFILFIQTTKSQDSLLIAKLQDTVPKISTYVARVNRYHNPLAKGYFATIRDSAIYLSRVKTYMDFGNYNTSQLEKIDFRVIHEVRLSKPFAMGKNMLIGAAIGIVIGALIGHAQTSDSGLFGLSSDDKAVLGGFIGAGAGCITGAVIAKVSEKKFLIKGEWKSLEDMKETMQNIK